MCAVLTEFAGCTLPPSPLSLPPLALALCFYRRMTTRRRRTSLLLPLVSLSRPSHPPCFPPSALPLSPPFCLAAPRSSLPLPTNTDFRLWHSKEKEGEAERPLIHSLHTATDPNPPLNWNETRRGAGLFKLAFRIRSGGCRVSLCQSGKGHLVALAWEVEGRPITPRIALMHRGENPLKKTKSL